MKVGRPGRRGLAMSGRRQGPDGENNHRKGGKVA